MMALRVDETRGRLMAMIKKLPRIVTGQLDIIINKNELESVLLFDQTNGFEHFAAFVSDL